MHARTLMIALAGALTLMVAGGCSDTSTGSTADASGGDSSQALADGEDGGGEDGVTVDTATVEDTGEAVDSTASDTHRRGHGDDGGHQRHRHRRV